MTNYSKSLSLAVCCALLLTGCATSYRPKPKAPPSTEGFTAFTFKLTPEQCAQLKKERRTYRAVEGTSVYVGGAGALVSVLATVLTDSEAAPAVSAGVSLAAGAAGAFTSSQVSDLDAELAEGGCSR